MRHLETLTYERIGREVATLIGKPRPVTKQQVSSWFAGSVPGMQLGLALARVLEIDPYTLGLTPAERTSRVESPGVPEAPRLPFKDVRVREVGARKRKRGRGERGA